MGDFRIGNANAPNNIKIGDSQVTKIMVGENKVWEFGPGYYDCGYGCQYYTYNPGCPSCYICTSYTLDNLYGATEYYTYTDCDYNYRDGYILPYESANVCAVDPPSPQYPSNINIINNGACF